MLMSNLRLLIWFQSCTLRFAALPILISVDLQPGLPSYLRAISDRTGNRPSSRTHATQLGSNCNMLVDQLLPVFARTIQQFRLQSQHHGIVWFWRELDLY